MAGNFILKSITQSDLHAATRFSNISWSASAAHKKGDLIDPKNPNGKKFLGWVCNTRDVLKDALLGKNIVNREGLPPHRYLEIKNWNILSDQEKLYIQGAGWAESLVYPGVTGLGLKSLNALATIEWNKSNKNQALIEMLKVGHVSIEVYYQSGLEMY